MQRAALSGELAQREQLSAWEAALVASGLPVAGLDLPKPKARMAIAAPLSAGIPGEAELVDVWLVERLPRWRVREALVERLPAGISLVDLHDVWLGEPPLPGRVTASVYRAEIGPEVPTERLAHAALALLAAPTLPRERVRGESTVSYDLRPFLGDLAVAPEPDGGSVLRMTLRHDPAKGVGRPDETLLALAAAMGVAPFAPRALAREALVVAEPPPPEPPAPRAARRPPALRASSDSPPRPGSPGRH
ncbi:MAG: DUF2344 domain-containing protein [Chloroflexota bacterium]